MHPIRRLDPDGPGTAPAGDPGNPGGPAPAEAVLAAGRPDPGTPASIPAADEMPGATDSPRVLVVDDEPSVIEVFREFLASQGYDLSVATSCEEALRFIPELRPDVILTDINLPGLSGLEVMRRAKDLDPEVAVIVVTGYASTSSAIDALRQGAYDYVTKPFDLDEIHQIVGRAIANRRLRDENRQLLEALRQKNEILQQHEEQLRERVRLATRQLTTLYEVGKEVSSNLELEPRLHLICARSAELTGARAAVVFLKHPEAEEFGAAAATGVDLVPVAGGPPLLESDGPLAQAGAEQRPVRCRVEGGGAPIRIAALAGEEFRSVLALPLIAENQVIGVLAVLDRPEGFTGDDESFLALFGSQTAIAVRNSQLFEHTKSLDRLKSEFVAVVSHEIRTPLTSVRGAIELLSDDRYFSNDEQQGKLLAIAHANAERLLVLINDILDFSKLESASLPMNIERQRIEPVIEQAAHNLRTQIEARHIQLNVTLSPELPDLMLDSSRIAQVVTNLLSNAIKFSPAGGRIELRAEPCEGMVRVSVRDHGEGIAPQDLPKLFRKFSQIDSSATRKAGGTGLGLVICRGIVDQHGGKIWVESTVDQGSTFHFTLPVAERTLPEPAVRG